MGCRTTRHRADPELGCESNSRWSHTRKVAQLPVTACLLAGMSLVMGQARGPWVLPGRLTSTPVNRRLGGTHISPAPHGVGSEFQTERLNPGLDRKALPPWRSPLVSGPHSTCCKMRIRVIIGLTQGMKYAIHRHMLYKQQQGRPNEPVMVEKQEA